jgi:hypothetical protein
MDEEINTTGPDPRTPPIILSREVGRIAWTDSKAFNILKDYHKGLSEKVKTSGLRRDTYRRMLTAMQAALPDLEEVAAVENRGRYGVVEIIAKKGDLVIDASFSRDSEQVEVLVWAKTLPEATAATKAILSKFPGRRKPGKDKVSFGFWRSSANGSYRTYAYIDCPTVEEIAGNYPEQVADEIKWLADLADPSKVGKVIVWHGAPGTGKTHMVRALARAWAAKNNAAIDIVVDPEKMSNDASYLNSVLVKTADEDDEFTPKPKKVRLIIIEDAAEMFMAGEARRGAGFGRLLNATDGILGQGTNAVFLFTANERIEDIDPALLRPGRCLQKLEFPRLTKEESKAWMQKHKGNADEIGDEKTIAELYAILNKRKPIATKDKAFGFAG